MHCQPDAQSAAGRSHRPQPHADVFRDVEVPQVRRRERVYDLRGISQRRKQHRHIQPALVGLLHQPQVAVAEIGIIVRLPAQPRDISLAVGAVPVQVGNDKIPRYPCAGVYDRQLPVLPVIRLSQPGEDAGIQRRLFRHGLERLLFHRGRVRRIPERRRKQKDGSAGGVGRQ